MADTDAIAELLGAVRRRRAARAALRAAANLLAAWTLALLAGLALAQVLGPGLGARTVMAAGLAGAVAWVARRLRAAWRGGDEDGLARLVGVRIAAVRSDLLSVVQLRREAAGTPLFSPALLDALAEQTTRCVATTRAAEVIPARELRRPALLALLAALALAVVGWRGRTVLATVAGLVEPPPEATADALLDDLAVEYRYPAYTGRPARTVTGSDGTLIGLRGTEVRVRGRPRRPLRELALVLPTGPVVARLDGEAAVVRLVLDRPGEYRFLARLRDGRRLIEDAPRAIVIDPDEPPHVDLVAPADDLEVDAATSVPLAFSAEDDFGLTSLDLVWRSGQGVEVRTPLALGDARRVEGKTRLDLDAADLRESVSYWLEASDNDAVAGPKRSRSRTFRVHPRREGDRRENALSALQEAFERAVLHLGDRLEIAPDAGSAPLLRSRLDDLVRTIAAARRAAQADRFAPPALEAELGAMAERLSRLLGATSGPIVSELERDVIELDRRLAAERVEDLVALAERIRRDRERLTERLAHLTPGDEAARREVERELAALQERVRELLARSARLAQELPAEFLNADAIPGQDLLAEMAEARAMLERGDVEGAKTALLRMGRTIDQAMAALDQGPGGEQAAARRRALAEALEEVGKLATEQRRIADGAGDIERRAATAQQHDLEAFMNEQQRKAERLRELLDDAGRASLPAPDGAAQKEGARRAAALAEDLAGRDLGAALAEAKGVREELRGRAEPLATPGRLAGEIARDLEAALAEPPVDEAGRAALRDLAGREDGARSRTGALAERLLRSGAGAGEGAGALHGAGESMRRGAENMRGGQPRGGHEAAQDAADRLASLEQSLRDADRSSSGAGRGLDREPVKVPGAEAYRPPRAWREEILEAMKQGAPEGYRELVRRYYQELIR
jgi:hypothetical protein